MNIEHLLVNDLLKGKVILAVDAGDLREFGLALIAEASAKSQQTDEKMLSADEVCKDLGISSNSLWRWGKSGYLKGQKVGRKVFYRKSDIDALQGK